MEKRGSDLPTRRFPQRLMRIDVNSFVGAYPFRRVPGTSLDALLRSLDRAAIDQAWVSHLPSVFWREPSAGNPWLYEATEQWDRLRPVPAVHPGLPGWERTVAEARTAGVPAVRCDPTYYGLDPGGPELLALAAACAAERLAVMLAVRLEDARQRHPNDPAAELPPWAVRTLIRSHPGLRLIVTHADRGFIQEVHFGSTPEESVRISWDICWIWGPPEDHLETLLRTIGVERFLFGTGQPLRIPEASVAKLDLLDLSADRRAAVESENANRLVAMPSDARGRSRGAGAGVH